jgi:hypothetical protein
VGLGIGLDNCYPPAQAGSSLAEFSTLKMETTRSSETSVHTRSTRRHTPEDGIILHETLDHLEMMDRSRLPKLVFNINSGDNGMLEDQEKDGKFKSPLSF